MNEAQNTKAVIVILPQSVGTTAVTGTVDTLGFDYCTISVAADTAAASSVVTTMAVAEADSGTSYTAITTLTNGTATGNFTPPVPSTSAGDITKLHVDLRGRKRYLQVSYASTTARLACVTAELSRSAGVLSTDALRGCGEVVYA